MNTSERPTAIDLFSGAGGMSLGFEQAGFHTAVAVESDIIHAKTYSHNFPDTHVINSDITLLSGEKILEMSAAKNSKIDVIFGGPPCQGFSMIGRRRTNDPRNNLLSHFSRIVKDIRPSYFVLENVEGILLGKMKKFVDSFLKEMKNAGYSILDPILKLNSVSFGVPQKRKRVFFVGYLNDLKAPSYPEFINFNKGSKSIDKSSPSVWDAIGDLPNVEDYDDLLLSDKFYGSLGHASKYAQVLRGDTEDTDSSEIKRKTTNDYVSGFLRTVHTKKVIRRFSKTIPGTYDKVSRFYRLTKNGYCNTLRAGTGPGKSGHTAPRPIHPVFPRCITVREAARLHSFPDWFSFHPTKWHGFRQVGNSVPPLLARAVAKAIFGAI